MNSWAEIVKFGQKRAPVGGPVKAKLKKTTVKRALSKPQVSKVLLSLTRSAVNCTVLLSCIQLLNTWGKY